MDKLIDTERRNTGIHARTHEFFVEGCFGCKINTVAISAHATPTKPGAARVVEIDNREKRWDRDMPAYKRLRQDGLQPKRIDGSARVEAESTTQVEVERGKKMAGGGKRFTEVDAAIKAGALGEVV